MRSERPRISAADVISTTSALPASRAATLPHWQRHPAVKAIIYQIDDALMEEYTTLPKAEKTRLRDVVAAFTGALRKLAGCPDDVIQHAVIAFDQQRNKYPRGEHIRRASMQLSQTAIDQHGRIAAAQDEDSA